MAARPETVRSGWGSILEVGPCKPCWRIGCQQPSPRPDGRLGEGSMWQLPWTIPLCPTASEGWVAAWGRDLGRGGKAKAKSQAVIV